MWYLFLRLGANVTFGRIKADAALISCPGMSKITFWNYSVKFICRLWLWFNNQRFGRPFCCKLLAQGIDFIRPNIRYSMNKICTKVSQGALIFSLAYISNKNTTNLLYLFIFLHYLFYFFLIIYYIRKVAGYAGLCLPFG